MKKIKVTLELDEMVINHLKNYEDKGVEISNILNKHFGKGYKNNPLILTKLTILERAYAYHKIAIDIKYTKQEFVIHFMKDKKFNKLYDRYVAANYDKELKPSFKKAKKLKDVKVLTYKKLMTPDNSRPVTYTYCGEKTHYKSINEACKALNVTRPTILRKLRADKKDPYEYWEFDDEPKEDYYGKLV